MRTSEAMAFFMLLSTEYFSGYSVIYSNQSRTPKPQIPLVVISQGNVSRPLAPNYETEDGALVGHYLSKVIVTVDLFTNGKQVTVEGTTVGSTDTSLDELLDFANFINSPDTVDRCVGNDISLLTEGDVQCITGVVNDTSYEYRSRMTVSVYFTEEARTNPIYFSGVDIAEESNDSKEELQNEQ